MWFYKNHVDKSMFWRYLYWIRFECSVEWDFRENYMVSFSLYYLVHIWWYFWKKKPFTFLNSMNVFNDRNKRRLVLSSFTYVCVSFEIKKLLFTFLKISNTFFYKRPTACALSDCGNISVTKILLDRWWMWILNSNRYIRISFVV